MSLVNSLPFILDQGVSKRPLDDTRETICGEVIPLEKNCILPTISPGTLARLLDGSLTSSTFDSVTIIDTRFPYEYEGGHIAGGTEEQPLPCTGAINVYQPDKIEELYSASSGKRQRTCLVLHCEFSSARAPKLFQFLRNLDRKKHAESYPDLSFPDMFILEGGYKAFYEANKDLCEPAAYVRMVDTAFLPQLRRLTSNLRKDWSNRSRNVLQDRSNSSSNTPMSDNLERSKRIKRCNFLS